MRIQALLLLLLACLSGCSKNGKTALEDLVAHLERNGIKGAIHYLPPITADVLATVTIKLDTDGQGMKMVGILHCKDEAAATRNYEEALKNPVSTGTTRNGVFVLSCTFVPPDPKRATEVQEVFRSYKP